MRGLTGLAWMHPKSHYCYHHYMAFLCSYSQKAVKEGVFTEQRIFKVAVFGL